MTAYYIWLFPLAPWLAAGWIAAGFLFGSNRGEAGEKKTAQVAQLAAGFSLGLILLTDFIALFAGSPGQVVIFPWLQSGDYQILYSFTLDALGLAVTTVVALVALLVIRFSEYYMHREAGFQRFFMMLLLFTGGMLLIVSAGNAALAFIGWEIAGVSSYLLIAYSYKRDTATQNATRAFITNRIGDAGFVLGIFLCYFWVGALEWPSVAAKVAQFSGLQMGLLGGAFLLAALAKSAQFPFTPWVGRALEGPTPSSAVFYGALMIHAGAYLVLRLEPVFAQSQLLSFALIFFGGLSALYGFLVGLAQTDVKSGLMFSTVGQVGLMLLMAGIGWFGLAATYLCLHAVWRSFQFLNAPSYLHQMHNKTRQVPRWLAQQHWLYSACLQRFWLDSLANWLLVRPVMRFSRDAYSFDQQFLNRFAGLPDSARAVSSLAEWESLRQGGSQIEGDTGQIGKGRGAIGNLMECIASMMHWFEEHLVLQGGDKGILHAVGSIGKYLVKVEDLLSQPRYLLLMSLITFIVII